MLAKILSWFRKTKAPAAPAALWSYVSHEYRGIADHCHVYLVSLQRGEERDTIVQRFHAGDHARHSDEKMAAHFRNVAAARNGG